MTSLGKGETAARARVLQQCHLTVLFRARQVWMAASEKFSGRPRLPVLPACQAISGSNRTDSEPRLRSAALKSDQFVVR